MCWWPQSREGGVKSNAAVIHGYKNLQLHQYPPQAELTLLWGYLSLSLWQEYMNYLSLALTLGGPCKAWLESPETDAFSSLQLLTESTGSSFPDSQIPLTHRPIMLHLPWLQREMLCPEHLPIPGWTCWLSVELHTQSIHPPLLAFGLNSCYKGRFHRPAAVTGTTQHVRHTCFCCDCRGCPY